MIARLASTGVLLCALVSGAALLGRAEELGRPRGPDNLPSRLAGTWQIGLVIDSGHVWLRFEDPETGEVHTLSRVSRGWGGRRDEQSGEWITPPVAVSGVYWDQDLFREASGDGDIMRTAVVKDPPIYWGSNDGVGYGIATNNCVTFVRDAWEHYTGEHYNLLLPHLPIDLKQDIVVRLRQARVAPRR